MAKKLLITGGAGFIGINTARHFLAKGWDVVLFDNFSRAGTEVNVANLRRDSKKGWKVVRGDVVTDLAALRREVGKADAVIHLAAQVAVTTSITEPRNDFEINALGTFNVLEAIRLSKNRPPLIYASTNKVYGSLPHLPVVQKGDRYVFRDPTVAKFGVSENEALDFHSPYGCSKGSADQYVIDYSRIYGLETVVCRQSCIYGEHQFGVEDQGWVAWFTLAVLGKKKITMYGNGKQVRDVLYVGDLVDLYDRLLSNMKKVSGKAYNVGGGPQNTVSLLEFMQLLKQELERPVTWTYAPVRAGDQPIFVADVRRLKKEVGWSPRTSLAEGFSRMLVWMQSKNGPASR